MFIVDLNSIILKIEDDIDFTTVNHKQGFRFVEFHSNNKITIITSDETIEVMDINNINDNIFNNPEIMHKLFDNVNLIPKGVLLFRKVICNYDSN